MNDEKALLIIVMAPNPAEQETLGRYIQASGILTDQYGGQILARLGVKEQIHGTLPAALIGIAEFPSAQAIKDMFGSAEYEALIPDRDKSISSLALYISKPGQTFEVAGGPEKSFLVTMAMPNPNEMESLGEYQKGAGPLSGKHGAKPLANIGIAENFYGDTPAAFLSVAEFPDAAAIKGFFSDEDYQPLIPLRDKALSSLNLYFVQ